MRKSIIILMLVCCSVMSLASCSVITSFENKEKEVKQVTEETKKTDNSKEDDTTPKDKNNEENKKETNTEDSNDKQKEAKNSKEMHEFKEANDFWILYDGKKYNIPIDNSLFNGWETKENDKKLKSHQYGIGASYKKDGYNTVSITPYNDSSETKSVEDCKIVGIAVEALSSKKTIDIELPNGIKPGSTHDEVLEAFGEPTTDKVNSNNDSLRIMEYKIDTDSFVKLKLTKDKVTGFEIKHIQ